MRKLNICLVSIAIPPDFEDGASKFFRGIFEYLRKQGHKVTLLTGKWSHDLNDENIHQINFIRQRFFWYPQFVLSVIKYLRSHEFDIVHGNGPKCTLPIFLARQKLFVSTIHDLGPFETKFTLIPFEKYLIKQTINKATYITTCSDIVRHDIKKFLPKASLNSIFNLYSAIEDKYKPHLKEAEILKQKLGIDGPVLLYIGRIAHYKGVEGIITAYKIAKKEIPNLNLVMGGKPDFAMEKKYQEWKKNYGDIHFVGFISTKEIPFYYTMGDIFVTYSHASEGFGLTPIEAIACGTPVIASSMPAYKEVLQDNAIFVPPKRPKILAREIINLLKNNTERSNLINKAQKFIKQYSWDSVGKKLENVYMKLIKNE